MKACCKDAMQTDATPKKSALRRFFNETLASIFKKTDKEKNNFGDVAAVRKTEEKPTAR